MDLYRLIFFFTFLWLLSHLVRGQLFKNKQMAIFRNSVRVDLAYFYYLRLCVFVFFGNDKVRAAEELYLSIWPLHDMQN